MYMVCSRWEVLPGRDADFETRGRAVRNLMRAQPGVKFVEGFRSDDGTLVAVVGYESKNAYDAIVQDANGPFQKAIAQHQLEECSRWISSERGESLD